MVFFLTGKLANAWVGAWYLGLGGLVRLDLSIGGVLVYSPEEMMSLLHYPYIKPHLTGRNRDYMILLLAIYFWTMFDAIQN